ncbi:MAG: DUF5615 family PIN-like protein [Thermoguttaceae bacterium]
MDHHVRAAVTNGLRRRGIDVRTAFEDGRADASDEELLTRAMELGRIVFTQDDDFLAIADDWQRVGRHFAGVIYRGNSGDTIPDSGSNLSHVARIRIVSPEFYPEFLIPDPKQLFADIGILKVCATPLGAEGDLKPDPRKGLWHGLPPYRFSAGKSFGFTLPLRGNCAVTGGMKTEGDTPKNSASFEMFSLLMARRPANTALIVERGIAVAAATCAWLTSFDSIR